MESLIRIGLRTTETPLPLDLWDEAVESNDLAGGEAECVYPGVWLADEQTGSHGRSPEVTCIPGSRWSGR